LEYGLNERDEDVDEATRGGVGSRSTTALSSNSSAWGVQSHADGTAMGTARQLPHCRTGGADEIDWDANKKKEPFASQSQK
jgi:hypothetical protein